MNNLNNNSSLFQSNKQFENEKYLVSVLIITYKHEDYIKECLDGILKQICNFKVEIVIANDCSPDCTDEIVREIMDENHNETWIKYLNPDKNIGAMQNFINAYANCTGSYIALCEGDDYWTDPYKLQKQIDFFREKPEMVFCFHNADRLIQSTGKIIPYIGLEGYDHLKIITKRKLFKRIGGSYPTASAMFKKSISEGLPPYFQSFGVGDTPLLLLAISKGEIGYLKDSMCIYRTTETNWSSDNNIFLNKYNNYQKLLNAYLEFNTFTQNKFHDELKLTYSHLTYQVVFAYFIEETKIIKRFSFFFKHQNRMIVNQRIKAFVRLFIT